MVIQYLKDKGYTPAEPLTEQETWLSWYRGEVKGFHDYTVYNGQKKVSQKRKSMQMAKKVCEDWATLLLNEKTEITTEDANFKLLLDEVFRYNSFSFRANQLIELVFALGTGAFVEYFDAKNKTIIDYVRGDCIYPLSWDNGEITECAFASVRKIDDKKCFYISIHELQDNGLYKVTNRLIDAENGDAVALPTGVKGEVMTNSDTPRFQILQPNLVNNTDLDSPYGISILANNIGKLEKVDLVFDSGNNEFRLGRKRIILPLTMAQVAVGDAKNQPVFDVNDVAFYGLNIGGAAGEAQKPIDLTGELRIDEHSKGLQDALNYLSDGCGLGTDRYEYSRSGGVKTATEVISEKSSLYQNLQKHKLVIKKALIDLCNSIATMNGIALSNDVVVNFDDSIIQDDDAKRQKAMLEFTAGLIDEVQYHMEVYGLTEEMAIEKVEKMNNRKVLEEPEPEMSFDTGGDGEDIEETVAE